jgi:hypothetical protein
MNRIIAFARTTGILVPLLATRPSLLLAQHEHPAGQADSAPAMGAMEGPLGIPHTRMGSGTTWLPDANPMNAWHWMAGQWTLMLHGQAFLIYNNQRGRRGDDQVASTNWGMLMAMRPLAGGMLHLHGMLSLEPFTVGDRGYPLLLQSGETFEGQPLHDRQHPHDLFMEIAAMYERPIGKELGLSLYLAPVGEPAIGPVAFMHRHSAEGDPFATLAHHWQDATHITYGVITAGVFTRIWKLEGTIFNGREPDEERTDFDFRPLDSYGFRLSINPSERLALSASYGFLESPEVLEPDDSQDRIGASLLHIRPMGTGHHSSSLVYGANKHSDGGGFEHSLVLETNFHFQRNSVFGRLTFVQKDASDLVVPVTVNNRFDIYSFSLGYLREVGRLGQATFGLGGRIGASLVPRDLEPAYGTRTPVGIALYLRVMPGESMMQHGDNDALPSR